MSATLTPSTTCLPLGTKRSDSNVPERSSSNSRKVAVDSEIAEQRFGQRTHSRLRRLTCGADLTDI